MIAPILITGCHGLLGQKLVETFSPMLLEMHGVDLHESSIFSSIGSFTYHRLDLTNRAEVLSLIREIGPKVILNTAAMTQVDACEIERERCWNVNVEAVHNLVDGARRVGAQLVQISTDYVFDGTAGPYSELDRPNPLSFYGKSKHASENLVLAGGSEGTVIRTMVLFGHGRNLKPSFVSWLVSRLKEGASVKIVTDQTGNVTLVDDLALAILRVVELRKNGLFHAAGKGIHSRYEFALAVAEAYNLDPSPILSTLTRLLGQPAPRPLQSGLQIERTEKELGITFRTLEESLITYRAQEAGFN